MTTNAIETCFALERQDPDVFLVAMPPATIRVSPIPGNGTYRCDVCGCSVWVAPSGQEILEKFHATLICLRCAGEWIPGDSKAEPRTGNQQRELEELLPQPPPKLDGESFGRIY